MGDLVIPLGPAKVRVGVPADERLAPFWTMFAQGRFEPGTVSVLQRHLGAGTTFVDLGAWLGPFTLLAASLGASVVAYEPDPLAVVELRANLDRNPALAARVVVHDLALSDRSGVVTLAAPEVGLGNGRSRLMNDHGTATRRDTTSASASPSLQVVVHTVDARVESATPAWTGCTLLKIDIEGAEYRVVPRLAAFLRQRRPAVLLSLHGPDPEPVLAMRYGRLRLLPLRVAGAAQRARLLWVVGSYSHRYRAAGNRTDDWQPLSRFQLVLLALRVGETELYLHQ